MESTSVYRAAIRHDFRWTTQRITVEVEAAWRSQNGTLRWLTRTLASKVSPSPIGPWPGPTPAPARGYGVFSSAEKVIAYRTGTFYENDHWEGVRASAGTAPELEPLPAYAWWPLLRLPLEPGGPWFVGASVW